MHDGGPWRGLGPWFSTGNDFALGSIVQRPERFLAVTMGRGGGRGGWEGRGAMPPGSSRWVEARVASYDVKDSFPYSEEFSSPKYQQCQG